MGSPGETYTIKHDTIDRKAYMPGVLQAIQKIGNYESLVYGLEKLIFKMLIPIKLNQISRLIPSVGTGGQFKYALGIQEKSCRD